MVTGGISSEQYLVEEDYGDGTELSTTGFFIFGILTFWIYTVWKFHGLLTAHIKSRLKALCKSLDVPNLSPTEQKTLEFIVRHGFDPKSRVRNICVILYGLCVLSMILELIGQVLVEQQYLKTQAFDAFTMITVTLMALMFCLSSVLFISWVCKTVKKHEYHELLLVKWIMDPTRFRAGNPSNTFIQRWNRNQNWVGFFLVLTVPMTVSPAIAIYHIYGVIAEGGDFVFMIQVWSAVIFALAAVFHLWGTQLLIDMYNGHLRIEAVNQQHLRGGICISADVYNVVKKVIALNVVNIGRKELKNIADAPEIFRVLIDKEA